MGVPRRKPKPRRAPIPANPNTGASMNPGMRHDSVDGRPRRRWLALAAFSAVPLLGGCDSGCGPSDDPAATPDPPAHAGAGETPVPDPGSPTQDHTMPVRYEVDRSRGVRQPAIAGSWYPGSANALRESVEGYLEEAAPAVDEPPVAMIVPHAGHRWSGATAAWAYAAVRDRPTRRVFLIGPSHRVPFAGAAVPSVGGFETPLGVIPIDTETTDALARATDIVVDDRPHAQEHSLEIQLPFLQVVLDEGFGLVPIVIGDIDAAGAERIAEALRPLIGPNDLVLASSDFTHYGHDYGYVPFTDDVPARIERLATDALTAIRTLSAEDFQTYQQRTGDTICGFRPIMVLMSLLPPDTRLDLLQYDTSGRIGGDWARSVSYLSVAVDLAAWPQPAGSDAHGPLSADAADAGPSFEGPEVLDAVERTEALRLARAVLEAHVRSGVTLAPSDLGIAADGHLAEHYGVFVTLKIHEQLRGCIGNIWPRGPLIDAIVGRAIDAAENDRRFTPVTPDELDRIHVEISVLTPTRAVAGPEEIVIGEDGIVLSQRGRRAVFLPQVAPEQGWDLPTTLTELSVKAGLGPDAWRQGATFEVFNAQVFSEPVGP